MINWFREITSWMMQWCPLMLNAKKSVKLNAIVGNHSNGKIKSTDHFIEKDLNNGSGFRMLKGK